MVNGMLSGLRVRALREQAGLSRERHAVAAWWPAKLVVVRGPAHSGDSYYQSIRRLLPFMSKRDRTLFMFLARRLTQRKKPCRPPSPQIVH